MSATTTVRHPQLAPYYTLMEKTDGCLSDCDVAQMQATEDHLNLLLFWSASDPDMSEDYVKALNVSLDDWIAFRWAFGYNY